jgi:hypothetical protein
MLRVVVLLESARFRAIFHQLELHWVSLFEREGVCELVIQQKSPGTISCRGLKDTGITISEKYSSTKQIKNSNGGDDR